MTATATMTAEKKAPAPKRLMRWLAKVAPMTGVLQIIMVRSKTRSETFRYFVAPIPGCDFGPAFRVEKIEHGEDGKPTGRVEESYDVNLHGGGSCQCLGFLKHGRPCKHIDALAALVEIEAGN